MGVKIAFTKAKLGGVACFLPATPIDDAEFAKLGDREVYTAEFKKMRNWMFHKKYFAMLNLVMEHMDERTKDKHNIHTLDGLLNNLKIRLGHYDLWIMEDGKNIYMPKSISFASMDQHDFKEFYKATVDIVFAYYLPMEQHAFETAVVRMIGFDIK